METPGPDPTPVPLSLFADPLPKYPPEMCFLGDSALFVAQPAAAGVDASILTVTQANVVNITHTTPMRSTHSS
jgi:hypothetical protein